MKREARDIRDRMPRPVRRIPLSEGGLRKRAAGVILALLAAGLALFFSLRELTRVDQGWTWIDAASKEGPVSEVRLYADLGAGEESALTERKRLSALFSEASREITGLLSPYDPVPGQLNLYWINTHPNEDLRVDARLVRALKQAAEQGRWIFLGPVLEIWDGVYFSENGQEAALADPRLDADTAAAVRDLMALLSREDQISLRFTGEDTVCLNLSPQLRALGEEYGVRRYLDFGWTRNAFEADLLAEALTAAGWTRGLLSSPDGFTRCLDGRGSFLAEIRAEQDGKTVTFAQREYQGPAAVAQLVPAPAGSRARSFRYEDGSLRTPWISAADGLDRRPVDGLTLVGPGGSCGDLAGRALALLTGDDFDWARWQEAAGAGIRMSALLDGKLYETDSP